ncbi:MAG TPA: glycosyltransferase family 2 protein [Candidatus Eisenbacteria bacterium]|nr:glycosyltransferase family 2 protein [Candidatus Eisenbacteria bacterium]
MGLSLIVVHYQTREALGRLFASLSAAKPGPLREIVVVNNSGEALDDLVSSAGWPTRLLASGRNLGYAKGVNAGIRAASAEDVLILNPDVRVRPGAIEALVAAAGARPRAGIVAPRLLNPDGTLQLSARRFYNWKTLLLRRAPLGALKDRSRAVRDHLMADWDHAETRPVDWVLGAAMYVRRRAMRDVGLMDERYFLYFEDVDWCQRMWRHGYEVVYCADALMDHDYARESARLRPRSLRAHVAGLLRFTEKWSALVFALNQYRRRFVQGITLGADIIAAVLACLVAYGARALLDPWFEKPLFPVETYRGLFFFAVTVTVASLAMNGLYRRAAFRDGIERAFLLGQAVAQAGVLLMASTFLFQTPRYSRVLVLLLLPLLFLFLILGRWLLQGLAEGVRRQGFAFRRVLLLGSGDAMERARVTLEGARASGFEPLHAETPTDGSEPPEAAAKRLRELVESERIQVVCIVPEPDELPYLLSIASALRDSGVAVYWAGSLSHLAPAVAARKLGPIDAVLLHAPSRGLSLKARKRASDLFLSLLVAPWRWRGLAASLKANGEGTGAGDAWRRVWSGERSWVGRSAYERDRWVGVPAWARLALESLRPGVFSPANGSDVDRFARVEAELAYLTRFSLAEDLRVFLRATREGAR